MKNGNFIKYGGGYYEKNCRSYFYAGCSIIFVRICILSCKNFSCIRTTINGFTDNWYYVGWKDNEWEIISPNQLSAITPLKGRNIRIAIYVEGTEHPGFLRIYNGGRDITSQTRKPLADEPLSGSDKIVYGWIKYYEIPMRLLTTESISISALDYFSNKTLYDHINFTIVRE